MHDKLAEAIRKVQESENLACYYDGINDTRTNADKRLETALELAGRVTEELSALREAVRRAADELGALSSTYTVCPGSNEMRVLGLVYEDAAAVADKLKAAARPR